RQGQAGVDNIFNDEDVTTHEVFFKVFEDPHDARGFGSRTVRRHRHEIDGDLRPQGSRQICHNHQRAFEHAHEQNVFTFVVPINLHCQVLDNVINLFASQ